MNTKSTSSETGQIAISDLAPTGEIVTDEDKALFKVYIRILDGVLDGSDWQTIARDILQADPVADQEQARRRFDSYLARARWMCEKGIRQIGTGDPTSDFQFWVANILKYAISQGRITIPDVASLHQWAHEEIADLIEKEILSPDPDLSPAECEKILIRHFSNKS
tara:strand:- start:1164 stop:1658 length:495 start_codon:yes stop_codon:yes gene_type:complete